MKLSTQKTTADAAAFKRKIVFRFPVPDDFIDRLRARAASAYVDVEITPGTNLGTPVRLSLGYEPRTTRNPT